MRAFSLLFRDSAAARMMDAFIELQGGEISKSDLAKAAGISRDSVYRILPEWESLGLVRLSRRVGVTKLYSLAEHPSVAAMKTIDGLFNGPQQFVRKTKPRRGESKALRTGPPPPAARAPEREPEVPAPAEAGGPAARLKEMLRRGVISEKTYQELVKKLR
ncbi:MAG: helix-turn-helix domain-containing protein [Halobacteria archaeon]